MRACIFANVASHTTRACVYALAPAVQVRVRARAWSCVSCPVASRRVASCCVRDFRASGWSVGLRWSSRAVVAVVEGPPGEGPRNG